MYHVLKGIEIWRMYGLVILWIKCKRTASNEYVLMSLRKLPGNDLVFLCVVEIPPFIPVCLAVLFNQSEASKTNKGMLLIYFLALFYLYWQYYICRNSIIGSISGAQLCQISIISLHCISTQGATGTSCEMSIDIVRQRV